MCVSRPPAQSAGGMQRMVVALANGLAERGHDVSLLTWDRREAKSFFELSPDVTWHRLGIGDPGKAADIRTRLARLPALRRIVAEDGPDVIVCFSRGPFQALLAALMGSGPPIIASERNAPTVHRYEATPFRQFFANQSYRLARAVTVQFERYRRSYPRHLREKIVALPNSVPSAIAFASPSMPDKRGRFQLLSVGRLAAQKNHRILLEAFSMLSQRFDRWDLCIVGGGQERAALEAYVANTPSLAGRIRLAGASSDVNRFYRAANLFCLSSLWEGFPNVLGEALAHGLPAVGFEGCAGVPDLIEDGTTGFLAPGNDNARALADTLAEAMASPERLATMGSAAARSMDKYAPDRVFARWEQLLDGCRRR